MRFILLPIFVLSLLQVKDPPGLANLYSGNLINSKTANYGDPYIGKEFLGLIYI